ncbi:small integral membrane protein 44 isoform X2 [Ictidomys tridecemlineatus]
MLVAQAGHCWLPPAASPGCGCLGLPWLCAEGWQNVVGHQEKEREDVPVTSQEPESPTLASAPPTTGCGDGCRGGGPGRMALRAGCRGGAGSPVNVTPGPESAGGAGGRSQSGAQGGEEGPCQARLPPSPAGDPCSAALGPEFWLALSHEDPGDAGRTGSLAPAACPGPGAEDQADAVRMEPNVYQDVNPREGGGKKKGRKKDQEGGEHNLGLELAEDLEAAKRTAL